MSCTSLRACCSSLASCSCLPKIQTLEEEWKVLTIPGFRKFHEEHHGTIPAASDVQEFLSQGKSPVMRAAEKNAHPEMMRSLIHTHKHDINRSDYSGENALYTAVKHNVSPLLLDVMLKGGAHVNRSNVRDETPLFACSKYNVNPALCRMLLDAGANVHHASETGETPLTVAVENNVNPEIVSMLLKAGGDVSCNGLARNELGECPLLTRARLIPDMNPQTIALLEKASSL